MVDLDMDYLIEMKKAVFQRFFEFPIITPLNTKVRKQ